MSISDLQVLREALAGPRGSSALCGEQAALARRSFAAIETALGPAGFGSNEDPEKPVFIFSAGWRGGSTWLQRVLMAGGRRLVWGEPWNACGIVQGLRAQLAPVCATWPRDEQFAPLEVAALSSRWVADLYPQAGDLWGAHRAFLDRLFAEPARQRGFSRWGFKEVRLGIEDALYLQWVYPAARFLFLVRNPFDAWRSYRAWRNCFVTWPGDLVDTPGRFGRMWRELAADFISGHVGLRALLVYYESLNHADTLNRIREFLDESIIEPGALARQRGAPGQAGWIPRIDRFLLGRAVNPLARKLGYSGPSGTD